LQQLLGSTQTTTMSGFDHPFVMEWGEDDDIGAGQIAWILAAAGLAGGGTALATKGTNGLAIGGAAGGGGLTMFVIVMATEWPDPDDFLGRAAYHAGPEGIQVRGQRSHDGNVLNDNVEIMPLIPASNQAVAAQTASQHPAVDSHLMFSNVEAANASCLNDADCTSTKRCLVGACVPPLPGDPTRFDDRSLPLEFDPSEDSAGTIEWRDYVGSGAHYRGYVSTSVSGKNVLGSP
jgi:hypothetical protein